MPWGGLVSPGCGGAVGGACPTLGTRRRGHTRGRLALATMYGTWDAHVAVEGEKTLSSYYIISPANTIGGHRYISLFRPNNAGYAWCLPWAGRYSREMVLSRQSYYCSGTDTIAVPCDVVEAHTIMSQPGEIDGGTYPCLPNTTEMWGIIVKEGLPTLAPVVTPHSRVTRKKGTR